MDVTGAIASLRTYRAGAHRLEHVATQAGVVYINDSKATNPHAAAAAIASFPSVVWIAGGLAKGVDMAPLNALIKDRVRTVVTIGTDGPIIAELARGLGVPVVEAGDLPRAVTEAALAAQPGDVVLLAPACASMDQFRDYADRGHCFVEAVHGLSTGRMTANGGS
jgi:UDP-N-acetylmuramoylalanine--D-glutamate ligase